MVRTIQNNVYTLLIASDRPRILVFVRLVEPGCYHVRVFVWVSDTKPIV